MADQNNPEMLIPTDIWYLEDENRFHLFRDVTTKMFFIPGVGMIGRVLASKKTLWIEDVTVCPNFLRTKLVDDIGVHGAVGFPVIVGGRVTAVLEFFSPKEEKSSPSLMDLMDAIGIQLGIVIASKQAEEGI
jgi:GAF domain-containing protein